MRRSILTQLCAAALLLLFTGVQAQMRYRVENVPNVQLQDYLQYVSDPERIIGYSETEILNGKLRELRDSSGVQAAVVVLPAIDDENYGSAKEFATELFNRWGIGDRETNNGLLILLLTAEGGREVVFETGQGLESVLTDGLCKLIQTRKMIPFLKEGAYGEGLIAGVDEVEKVLKGTSELIEKPLSAGDMKWPLIIWLGVGAVALYLNESRKKKALENADSPYQAAVQQSSSKGLGCLVAGLFFPVFLLYRIFKGFGKKSGGALIDCTNCKSQGTVSLKKGEPVIRQQAIPGQDGMKEYEFVCSNCGFVHKELVPYKYVKPQTESHGSTTTTYRSSSSRGGSWGGGSSGGGGASTKF